MTITDARALVTRYPACVPHALALTEEISRPHVANPAGLLQRLVERGWTPPVRPPTPVLPADDPLRFLRSSATGRCLLCDEPLEVCGGMHLPPWAREPAPPGRPASEYR